MHVRTALPADADRMFELHVRSVQAICARAYSEEHIRWWFHERTARIYDEFIAEGQIWVADDGESLVGFVGARDGEVTLLFVHPDQTGKGFARLLFEHGLSRAGAPHRDVHIAATKNSATFYSQYGFKTIGEEAFERGPHCLQYPTLLMLLPKASAEA